MINENTNTTSTSTADYLLMTMDLTHSNNYFQQHQTNSFLITTASSSCSRVNNTPKRRLSYNNTPNSTNTITNPSATQQQQQQQTTSAGSTNVTPFIKRKCLQENTNLTNTWRNHSPQYNCSSSTTSAKLSIYTNTQQQVSPFTNDCIIPTNFSPRHLNESFETLQINNNENLKPEQQQQQEFKLQKKRSCRRGVALSKFKSAPIQMLDFEQQHHHHYQPLGDISNTTSSSNTANFNYELEDLCFGAALKADIDEKQIKDALEADANGQNLIGDRSRTHLLPFRRSTKHQDLHCITPETLVNLLDGKFDDEIEKVIIIDSRYPYEYDGGHIATARNIFTKEKLLDELFVHRIDENNETQHSIDSAFKSSNKRVIIIFHCEFSSERGPSLLRFLRNQDRQLNEHAYPKLFYPELYLLEGGYKNFYEKYKTFCQPQEYKPMLHEMHLKEMKHFRSKAKSWEVQKHHLSASNIKLSASSLTIKHLTQKTFSLASNLSACCSASSSNSTLEQQTVKFE